VLAHQLRHRALDLLLQGLRRGRHAPGIPQPEHRLNWGAERLPSGVQQISGGGATCVNDFGAVLGVPIDSSGNIRVLTHHVQSSWQFNRSVSNLSPDLHETNRSYAHHQGLVLRDTLELGTLLQDRAMGTGRQDGHCFFNPSVVSEGAFLPDAPDSLPAHRHDFWAGVHHAGGVWCYKLSALNDGSGDRNAAASEAAEEGLELLKGWNALGRGLREALANGQKWQVMRQGDAGPPWLTGWSNSLEFTSDIEFGRQSGRTFGRNLEFGYLDICTTALRLGQTTWLIVTNSVDEQRTIGFDHPGAATVRAPHPGATLALGANGVTWTLAMGPTDAAVLRLDP